MLRDTSVTPYTRLPVSTVSTSRLTTQSIKARNGNLRQFAITWRQSTAICRSPPYSAIFCQSPPNSAKFCQDRSSNPILLRARVDRATRLTIYTLSSRFLIFSPHATSWLHHAVYVHSLIISTLLYIITAYARSVTVKIFTLPILS